MKKIKQSTLPPPAGAQPSERPAREEEETTGAPPGPGAAVTGSHLRRNQGSKLTAKPLPVTQEVSSVLLLVEEEGEAGHCFMGGF